MKLNTKADYGRGGTYISHSKESLSLVYLLALLAKLGLNHNTPEIDNDSIDISIRGKGFTGRFKKPKIELQLKCSNAENLIDQKNNELVYKLKQKNYNDLAEESPIPLILVIHHAPKHQSDWIIETDSGATIKNISYWYCLTGREEISQGEKVIRIPLDQKFDSDALMWMMEEASKHNLVANKSEVLS